MPRKLRRSKALAHRITAEAIEAWRAADYHALHAALGLRPWEPSPLPLRLDPLGVDPDQPPAPDGTMWFWSWPKAIELQRELYAVAGEPGRAPN